MQKTLKPRFRSRGEIKRQFSKIDKLPAQFKRNIEEASALLSPKFEFGQDQYFLDRLQDT